MRKSEIKTIINNMPTEATQKFKFDIINGYLIISNEGGSSSMLLSLIQKIETETIISVWGKQSTIFAYLSTGRIDTTIGYK